MKRWWALLAVLGLAVVFLHFHLAGLQEPDQRIPLVMAHLAVAFLFYLGGAAAAERLRSSAPALVVLWIFLVAAASMAPYLHSSLLLSPEVNRYRWDGYAAEAGYDPYRAVPQSSELDSLRVRFGEEIPTPDRTGLYPPLAELLFYGMARLHVSSVFHYRAFLAAAALLAGLLVIALLRQTGMPIVRTAWFLWHPLLILESAGGAHLEILALLFLLASLALLATRHHLTPGAALALAGLTKSLSFVTLPLYFRRVPPYRILLFALVLIAGAIPFLGAGPALVTGTASYLAHARFNPGVYALLERLLQLFGEQQWTRLVVGFSGIGIALGLAVTDDGSETSLLRRAFYLVLVPLLLGPVLHPWFLIWVLPFFALLPRDNPWFGPALLLSGTVMLAYMSNFWGSLPAWVSWLEFGPVGLLLTWEFWRTSRTIPAASTLPSDSL